MPKAMELDDTILTAAPPVPRAAIKVAPVPVPVPVPEIKEAPAERREPLQVRWPEAEIKAVKMAALTNDQTVSDFLLACFHASMKAANG